MKLLFALAVGAALLLPVNADAEKTYRMYWVTYYPVGPGGTTISLVDKTEYRTFDECQAAEAKWPSSSIRWWSDTGYYVCM